MTNKIVMVAVGLLIGIVLFNATMTTFIATNTTGWSTSLVTVWGLLPLLGLLGIALMIFSFARGHMGSAGD